MAGTGRPPKEERHNPRDVPKRGDWQTPESIGWQHGDIPKPPGKYLKASLEAWKTWMGAWFAAFWSPDDLPGLFQMLRLYDAVQRGELQRAPECRLQMEAYGITPKGQQDRRWKPPSPAKDQAVAPQTADLYGHLRVVND